MDLDPRPRIRMRWVVAVAIAGIGVAGLAGIFFSSRRSSTTPPGGAAAYMYQVGRPGPGEAAPPVHLTSTDGGTFDLASLRGQTVLLYFQEGVMCEPCWTQLRDIERNMDQFRALGIDRIVSITTDPSAALKQKTADEALTTPVLSDSNVGVSKAYQANQYGMMGEGQDGHSFILVNKDGVIAWRADYGGAPAHTMYVPVPSLLNDIKRGLAGAR
ncbi:MAG TPA: peroxiredoxin family protein [Dehalococcoidia bacterium]|nr:peroxiredoxin family protein [Dehalococcoidia bacterium]